MVSIIIPAHNEAAVIHRTLEHLLQGSRPDSLEIIVCCNGCTDDTAAIAQSFGPPVRVIETSIGSKSVALNMGDAAASSFPRIYLDADVLLGQNAVQSITQALRDPSVLAAAPRMTVDLRHRSWAIRAFYHIWRISPYHQSGMIGSGVYALSEAGRKRFGEFPNIIADDGFVRAHFSPTERKTLEDCTFSVTPPRTLTSLVRIKSRATLGHRELNLKYADLMKALASMEPGNGHRNFLWQILAQPRNWASGGVYLSVKTLAAFRARSQIRRLATYVWERDDTSRA